MKTKKAITNELSRFDERPPETDFQRGYLSCLIDLAVATGMKIDPQYRAMWRAIRKEAGLKIDPATAEVTCMHVEMDDPYGLRTDLPAEPMRCVGREFFARSPRDNIWVSFGDLPKATLDALWEKR